MLELLLVAVVQIITEMAPISSSGHWRLVEVLAARLGQQLPVTPRYFDEFLHIYALVIIAWFFRRSWVPIAQRLFTIGRDLVLGRRLRPSAWRFMRLAGRVTALVVVANVLTVLGYGAVAALGCQTAWYASPLALATGFMLTACMLVLSDLACPSTCPPEPPGRRWKLRAKRERSGVGGKHQIPHYLITGVVLGLVQASVYVVGHALVPGVSRFASIYLACCLLGYGVRRALELTWLVFLPPLVGAAMIHGFYKFILVDGNWFVLQPVFLTSCLLATVVGYGLLCLVARLAHARRLWLLAVYLLLPMALLFW